MIRILVSACLLSAVGMVAAVAMAEHFRAEANRVIDDYSGPIGNILGEDHPDWTRAVVEYREIKGRSMAASGVAIACTAVVFGAGALSILAVVSRVVAWAIGHKKI